MTTGACSIIDYVREDGTQSPFPLIRCENIFVLPGVPGLLQAKWKVQFGVPTMSDNVCHCIKMRFVVLSHGFFFSNACRLVSMGKIHKATTSLGLTACACMSASMLGSSDQHCMGASDTCTQSIGCPSKHILVI